MNCLECQHGLQRRLDGEGDVAALAAHLAACVECRELHEAARRLLIGLGADRRPAPPDNLSTRIVSRVLRDLDRRQTLRRRVWIGVSLAASVLVMVLAGYLLLGLNEDDGRGPAPIANKDATGPKERPKKTPKDAPAPSGPNVEAARQAVAALSGRLAEATRGQAKLLLAAASAWPPAMPPMQPEQPFDTAALRQTSQGVGDGVQTVARSARRAVDYFLRELVPAESREKN